MFLILRTEHWYLSHFAAKLLSFSSMSLHNFPQNPQNKLISSRFRRIFSLLHHSLYHRNKSFNHPQFKESKFEDIQGSQQCQTAVEWDNKNLSRNQKRKLKKSENEKSFNEMNKYIRVMDDKRSALRGNEGKWEWDLMPLDGLRSDGMRRMNIKSRNRCEKEENLY